ncbi:hypothetical protein DXZ20_04510 [Leptolyngbyaceae cyanobacterium CCMR0081]|uniref:Uncharacterized protein n=1 Tax=Adonisia turfae CCMR0081 TaxID=2292702 RepID=A0A6M0RFH1_9CYAN|nr:hypothetical protein [Adonisia turfae CCMR0081]
MPLEVRGDCAAEIPPLTDMTIAADTIQRFASGANPVAAVARRCAYRLCDFGFGATTGTTQRIYELRQQGDRG